MEKNTNAIPREGLDHLTMTVFKLNSDADSHLGRGNVFAAIEKIRTGMDIVVNKFGAGGKEQIKLLTSSVEKMLAIYDSEVVKRPAEKPSDLTLKASIAEKIFNAFNDYGISPAEAQEMARNACKYLIAPIGITLRLGGSSSYPETNVPIGPIIDRARVIAEKAGIPELQSLTSLHEQLGDKAAAYVKPNYNMENLLRLPEASLNDILLPKFDL